MAYRTRGSVQGRKATACAAAVLALSACTQNIELAKDRKCVISKDFANRETMRLVNDGQWCSLRWVASTADRGTAIHGGAIVGFPVHGAIKLVERDSGTWYAYLPAAGYSGEDQFTIAPSGPFSAGLQHVIYVEVRGQP